MVSPYVVDVELVRWCHKWSKVACSGEAKLWVNGAVVQTLNIGAGLELATQDSVRMGVKTDDSRYFKGRIAQMRIYNRALNQEQIQAIQKLVVAGNEKNLKSKIKCSLECEK